jgi:hypothetical protein
MQLIFLTCKGNQAVVSRQGTLDARSLALCRQVANVLQVSRTEMAGIEKDVAEELAFSAEPVFFPSFPVFSVR